MTEIFGKIIGRNSLFLIVIASLFQCSVAKESSHVYFSAHRNRDLTFIKNDSLLLRFCADNYSSNSYNCDSIIRIDKIEREFFPSIQTNSIFSIDRFYAISFELEEDFIDANVLVYRISNDSVWLYRSKLDNDLNFNLSLMFLRERPDTG